MITVRKFKPDDMFSIINIAFTTLPEQYHPNLFNHFFESFPDGFLIAECNHKLIGFIAGVKTSKKTAKIPLLAILHQYRRKGIGSALITQFHQVAKLHHLTIIDLEVRTTNKEAIQFYMKHGYSIITTIYHFYQNGDDAYLMRKKV